MGIPDKIKNQIVEKLIVRLSIPVYFICFIFCIVVIFFYPDQLFRLTSSMPVFVFFAGARFFGKRGNFRIGGLCLILAIFTFIICSMITSGGVEAPGFIGVIASLTIIYCLCGFWGSLVTAAFMLILGAISLWLISAGVLPPASPMPPSLRIFHFGLWFFLAILFASVPIGLMIDALRQSHDDVREKDQSKADLEAILNENPDIIFRLDTRGHVSFMNQAVCAYGFEPDQVLGLNMLDFIYPDDRKAAQDRFNQEMSGAGSADRLELRMLPLGFKDGDSGEKNSNTFLISLKALYHDNFPEKERCYYGIQGIARDITREKAREKQLQMFATVIDQVNEEVVITDVNGSIQYVNPSFEKNTGYPEKDVLGRKTSILKSGLHDIGFYEKMWGTITNKKIWKGIIKNKCRDGRILLHDMAITPILDSNNTISAFVSIRRDITEQAKHEEKLQQSHKMETIGTLAGGIAHDFNNILAGILGYAELVQEDLKTLNCNPLVVQRMGRLVTASLRARDLVAQILTFSRLNQDKPSPIMVKFILKEVLPLLRASLPSSIDISSFAGSESQVMADPTCIHQILMNLSTNARDAMMETGGVLTITLGDTILDEAALGGHSGCLPGPFICICVKDTGCGMEPGVIKRVMEPFFTTKPKEKGTGMGLSVVHGIVKKLNGFIEISSIPGKGSSFEVFLPVCENKFHGDFDMMQSDISCNGDEKILLVDDERIIAEMIRDSLESYGYDVTIFSDSVEALEYFKEHAEIYDIIISDITMPGMTGDLLLKELRLIRPEIPVILCTGFSERIDERWVDQMHVNALLYKPVPAEEMAVTIRNILDSVDKVIGFCKSGHPV